MDPHDRDEGAAANCLASRLYLGCWFGLMAGAGEVFVLAFRKLALGEYLHVNPQAVWMGPAVNGALFGAVAAALCVFGRLVRRVTRLCEVGMWTLAALCVTLAAELPMHPAALSLLALGAAMPLSHVVAKREQSFRRLRRRTLIPLAIAVALVALVTNVGMNRRSASRSPARAGAPNVVLVVMDTVRAESTSLHRATLATTPFLETLAQRGVLFRRAQAAAPWTLPSISSMLTGRLPNELSADWERPLDAEQPILAEVLAQHGYETAGFVANTFYCSRESGLNRGMAHYDDFGFDALQWVASTAIGRRVLDAVALRHDLNPRTAETVNRSFLRWLDRRPRRPFFAFLNYFDAHDPYHPDTAAEVRGIMPRCWGYVDGPVRDHERRTLLTAYERGIAYLDEQLKALYEQLRQRGLLENTLVIVTADHGEQFGEHGLYVHGNSLYQELLHVPLLIAFPGQVPEGAEVHEVVSLRDLPATVCDLLDMATKREFPGHSLARYWSGDASPPSDGPPVVSQLSRNPKFLPTFPNAQGPLVSVTLGSFHYIRHFVNDDEELYDFRADPEESQNLADDAAYDAELVRLRRLAEQPNGSGATQASVAGR